MGYAQLVIGPAGSGKPFFPASAVGFDIERTGCLDVVWEASEQVVLEFNLIFGVEGIERKLKFWFAGFQSTYCSSLYQHCQTIGHTIHVASLDPAAEHFDYPVTTDIRELISLDDVTEELGLGPNGGLIYCMEHLEENLDDWLNEELENFSDDDYLVFDCPGQIELFSHVPVLKNFVEHLQRKNFSFCAVYLLDSQFMTDVTKFISGCMASLSAMVQLELPHVNILSKMDLEKSKRDIDDYLNPEPQILLSELNLRMAPQFEKLNKALAELVDEYGMVSFVPLDLRKPSSVQYVLSQIDNCIQYGDDADVKVKDFDPDNLDNDAG